MSPPTGSVTIVPLPPPAPIRPGDDVAASMLAALRRAGLNPQDADVLCVASKVISTADDESIRDHAPGPSGRRAAARVLARRVVAETPAVLIVETAQGLVCANAGIDASNVEDGGLLALPSDPDGRAAAIRASVAAATGADVGIVVTDTFGRPWRRGQVDVAIGAAGIAVLRDERGGHDLFGRVLEVTVTAVADELAAAAGTVRRKASGTPFVLIRGLDVAGQGAAADLVRPAGEDLFRWGGPNAIEAALAPAPQRPSGPPPAWALDRMLAVVARLADGAPLAAPDVTPHRHGVDVRLRPDDTAAAQRAAGAAIIALRATARSLGLATAELVEPADAPGLRVGTPPRPDGGTR